MLTSSQSDRGTDAAFSPQALRQVGVPRTAVSERPPNPRVQRTRPGSPLTRHPLGGG